MTLTKSNQNYYSGDILATLKDIAKECNVSFSTVSKALKASPDISQKTINKVKKTARKMGYHPNISARALRTNKTFELGVIFEDQTGTGLQHQFFAKIFDGINVEAHNLGYDITFISDKMNDHKNYYEHACSRNCDGIAIVYTQFIRPDIQQLIESEIPTVTLDFFYNNEHTAIMSDNTAGMTTLTEYVISQGHKRIAFIHGENTGVTQQRLLAFTNTLLKHSIQIPEEYIQQAVFHKVAPSAEATGKLLSLPKPPTCIMYPDDFSLLGGIQELEKRNRKVGKDISITGYDGLLMASMLTPSVTTYYQNGQIIGSLMAKELISQIENREYYIPKVIPVEGKLIKGNSVINLNRSY